MPLLDRLPDSVPDLLTDFLITMALGFLVGLSLKEYYLATHKIHTFGSTRTYTFIGMMGFVLFQLDDRHWLYLGGLWALTGLLALYYHRKLDQDFYGLIGILTALLTYLIGPVATSLPKWFLLLFVVSTLFILNARAKIALLREKISQEETITLAKFLLLAGVILPLLPNEQIDATYIPVTPHQTWLGVVAVTGISYTSYLLQMYLLPGKGMLLTGALGGLYSSTATTLVLAKTSHSHPNRAGVIIASIVLATSMMYVRILGIVVFFSRDYFLRLLGPFIGFAVVGGLLAWLIQRRLDGQRGDEQAAEMSPAPNPLEIVPALIFAGLFVGTVAVTQFVLTQWGNRGLTVMSLVIGFTDIAPFVLSVVQGHFEVTADQVVRAIALATASNNLLKACYALGFGTRVVGRVSCGALLFLTLLPLAFALMWVR